MGLGKPHVQESKHEAFSIVSELLYEIMTRWLVRKWKWTSSLKSEISKKLWRHLNCNEMVPIGNYSALDFLKKFDHIMRGHLKTRNKSAVILDEIQAIAVNNQRNAHKNPNFLGKDNIFENLFEFKYFGHFPTRVLVGSRYYFQSGIIDWWQSIGTLMVKTIV